MKTPIYKKKIKTAGVLGYGQVGKAVAKLYDDPKIKDLKREDSFEDIDVLNVCIPYYDDFITTVLEEIIENEPTLTVIHSTVAPGTTKKINQYLQKAAKKENCLVVHSPVRGIHPDLYEGVKTFAKYIGADVLEAGILAEKHFRELGLKVKAFGPSVVTELGKLLSTTYYGLCIAYHGEMERLCDDWEINFDEVATHFNETYNQGYKKLGKDNVIRPVLYPPPPEGIGGHCIIDNVRILREAFPSPAFDFILDYAPDSEGEGGGTP